MPSMNSVMYEQKRRPVLPGSLWSVDRRVLRMLVHACIWGTDPRLSAVVATDARPLGHRLERRPHR